MQNELTIFRGSDEPTEIQFLEEETNSYYNLDNVTEITACFKNSDGTDLTKTLSGGSITIENSPSGIIKIIWDEAETQALKTGKNISFWIKLNEGTETIAVPFNKMLNVEDLLCG